MGVDVGGEGVFGDVLLIGAAGDDEDGEAQEDTLAAAAIRDGSVVGRGSGHRGDGLAIVLEKKGKRSMGGRYRCSRGGKRWSRRRESNPHGE